MSEPENEIEAAGGRSDSTALLAKPTPKRWFGLRIIDNKTEVQVAEFSDGSIQINLTSGREGMEPLTTSMRVCSSTFALLSEALFRAAHDPNVWRQFDAG